MCGPNNVFNTVLGNIRDTEEEKKKKKEIQKNYKALPWDFPDGPGIKNPPANAGDTCSIPGLGRSHVPKSN